LHLVGIISLLSMMHGTTNIRCTAVGYRGLQVSKECTPNPSQIP